MEPLTLGAFVVRLLAAVGAATLCCWLVALGIFTRLSWQDWQLSREVREVDELQLEREIQRAVREGQKIIRAEQNR